VSRLRRHPHLWRLGALAAVVAALPWVLTSPYHHTVLVFIGLHAIIVLGLVLLMGYAGQISLGQAAFYGLGAYVSGILTATHGWPVLPALTVAAVATAGVAAVIGAPILRLKGNYLAMATLALGLIVFVVFNELISVTGGPSGLTGIPRLQVLGWVVPRGVPYYYVVWGCVLAAIAISLNLVHSRVGRAMRAIHSSEVAAATLGVDAARLKVAVFALSAVFAGVAGSLYVHFVTFVNPPPFGFTTSIMVVVMAVLGGIASVWGALAGAAIVTIVSEALRNVLPRFLGHAAGEHELVVFGVILVLVMIFAPEGLVPRAGAVARHARGSALRLRAAGSGQPGAGE
jgi:branched-chain amino acid transport system permease protein